jgi:uncharacterized protein
MTPPIIEAPKPSTNNDKLWIVLCHLSTLIGLAILLPLIIYLVKKDESAVVAFHAKEALNFHISVFIYALGCVLLTFFCIGFPMLICLGIAVLILSIMAAVRGADGHEYRYPLTIRFIK